MDELQAGIDPTLAVAGHQSIHDAADYLVNGYSSVQLHSKLGNLSPHAFKHESTTKSTC